MAETSIQRARRRAKEKREREEAEAAAAKKAEAKKAEAAKPPAKKKGLLDTIREAFSNEDDAKQIEDAVNAMETGIDDADKDAKRNK